MGAIQIGRIFRRHHPVAQFPAKGVRIGEEVSVVAHEADQNPKEAPPRQKEGEFSPLTRIVEIEDRIRQGLFKAEPPAPAALPKQPVKKYHDAQDQEDGKDHVGEDSDIGTRRFQAETEQKEKEDQKNAHANDQAAEVTDRVAIEPASLDLFILVVHNSSFRPYHIPMFDRVRQIELTILTSLG